MLSQHRAWLGQQRRHLVVIAAIAALAGGVVLAHSAAATDHMGTSMAVCLALAETAALGVVALGAVAAFRRPHRSWAVVSDEMRLRAGVPAALPLPWPRGSPFALQVLRL